MTGAERREAAAGLVLAAAGAFFAAYAWRMPGSPDPSAPGPGAAPGALGLLMLAMGVVIIATALLRKPAVEATPTPAEEGAGRKLLIAAGLLAACVVAFEPAGFMLSTFLFLLAGFMLLGGASWRAAAPAAALASGGLWMFFTKLLGVGLPYGLIGEILFQ
jgi:putative tricarboxylic transport membrane protein